MSTAPEPLPSQGLALLWSLGRELLAITDGQGNLLDTNPRFGEVLGTPAVGTALASLLACGAHAALGQRFVDATLHGETTGRTAIALSGPDGSVVPVSALGTRLTDAASIEGPARWLWLMHEEPPLRAPPSRIENVAAHEPEVPELARSSAEANELLKLATDLAQISVWRQDLMTGRFMLNDHWYAISGLAPRAEGMSFDQVRDLMHPDDAPEVIASVRQTLATGKPTDSRARYRRGKEWRRVLARRALQYDAQGEPVAMVGVAMDITDQLEEARRASETARWLELAANAAGVGVWFHEATTGAFSWNEQMFALHGRDPLLGPPTLRNWIDEIIHPDDRAKAKAESQRLGSVPGARLETELRILRPDGQTRWIATRARRESVDGRHQVFGVCFDVTERVLTETALRNANEQVALAARGAGIGTWERGLDPDSLVWDAQMYRLRGLEPQDRPPCVDDILALVHPDDRPRSPPISSPDFLDLPPLAAEFRVRQPDGSYRWLASRATPIKDASGKVIRRVGVNWDITDAKNAETARRENELAQRESQAKSRFLARMSHELRTPLNAVLGFAQLLALEAHQLDDLQRGRLTHIRSAGEHLLALIDEVLDLSSLESGEIRLAIEPVPLAQVVQEAFALTESQARQAGVSLHTGRLDLIANADRIRLRQILVNLLSNAIKYNQIGGSALVEAEPVGDRLRLRVSDTGRGLNAAQRAHLFEPFNRLGAERENIEGTGIGLAIVKALVECMQGTVSVSSEPGLGTMFEIDLPAQAGLPMPASADSPPDRKVSVAAAALARVPAGPAGGGSLLYIEDNAVNVLLVEELVRSFTTLSIVSEGTGIGGVDRARAMIPDLILIDMQLPDIDGFEVLARLRADPLTADIGCVALSANAMPEDISRARAAGFNDYWTKPIDIDAFLSGLARVLEPAQVSD